MTDQPDSRIVSEAVARTDRLPDEDSPLVAAIKKVRRLTRSKTIAATLDEMLDLAEEMEGDAQHVFEQYERVCGERTEEEQEREKEHGELWDLCHRLEIALDNALGDREALLEQLGLTDFAWSMQGGACFADFDP